MKTKLLLILLSIVAQLLISACNTEPNDNKTESPEDAMGHMKSDQDLLSINASQFGVSYPETFVLMQNRRGIRIEYCVDRGALQLWISPQAGKSYSYVDKNWSSRDDHTRIFDRILFPELNLHKYDSCDWDPFHSKLYFGEQVLHISQVYEEPAVLVWLEKEGLVDFKIFGKEVSRTPNEFIFNHQSRGRDFQSAAVLSSGDGYFQQQRYSDDSRSTHTRAHLKPGQFLVVGSEIEEEGIGELIKEISSRDLEAILANNEVQINRDLKFGNFELNNRPVMQTMLDLNKRFALSMQDFKGFMRSTNQYIYYLLWYRDGGMNTAHLSYAGWVDVLEDQVKFALLNPNVSTDEPSGRFFGQVMGGPITKWEEDGLFYVLWPAFNYWSQSGDDTYIKGEYLAVIEEAMQWLEKYCYDEEKGLFGRYYYCETPLTGSHGDSWDDATGAPTFKWGSDYKGETIVRSYDNYINLINYANYMMLSAMTTGEKAGNYLNKAKALEANMGVFFDYDNPLPSYGQLLTDKGTFVTGEPYGMDIWDYVWGLSLPPFKPNLPQDYFDLQNGIYDFMTTTDEEFFICTYAGLLTSMDPFIHGDDKLMAALDYLVPFSETTGKYLNMPMAIPEMINVEDGNPFHDVRPLVYSIAPWISAVNNLGIRRLPFGLAVRGSEHLKSISDYQYKQSVINYSCSGKGNISSVMVNGNPLQGTLQVPENMFKKGEANTLEVTLDEQYTYPSDLLISSTVSLQNFNSQANTMNVECFGQNILTFNKLQKTVAVTDENGNTVATQVQKMDDLTYVEFDGRGKFVIKLVDSQ